jgi:acyl-CoA reductase-like NAD-dependent aldehyde dehydrogenase
VGQDEIPLADSCRDDPPFGFKQSGNGYKWGPYAFHDFPEQKAVIAPEEPRATASEVVHRNLSQ